MATLAAGFFRLVTLAAFRRAEGPAAARVLFAPRRLGGADLRGDLPALRLAIAVVLSVTTYLD
jgi:hypothetical protein